MAAVPTARIRALNARAIAPERAFVLYWMTSARRATANFALDRAIEHARTLKRPLVVLEPLRVDYRWASDRLHTFVIEGMAENEAAFATQPVTYYPYLEPEAGAGRGLLRALAAHACVVVADDSPAFFLPRMLAAAAAQVDVALEAVDGIGLIPLRATDHAYPTAYAFRRFVHPWLARHGAPMPSRDPFRGVRLPALATLPKEITARWPAAAALDDPAAIVARLPIDHTVPAAPIRGGHGAAERALYSFIDRGLDAYERDRNDPDAAGASGFSPYLHFGHLGTHEVVAEMIAHDVWTPAMIETAARGSRAGWGGGAAGAFLDQLVTWREIGFNMCVHESAYAEYDSLPEWARRTLDEHAEDPREFRYTLDEFADSATHDPLWNAAQRELRTTGAMHNYLRMLWGKKILEWTRSPREALAVMVELNNRYALDGRDPNSYSGIFWTLGRYDRAWGPVRPVFGKIRFMSSANTKRKLNVKRYLERFGAADDGAQLSLG